MEVYNFKIVAPASIRKLDDFSFDENFIRAPNLNVANIILSSLVTKSKISREVARQFSLAQSAKPVYSCDAETDEEWLAGYAEGGWEDEGPDYSAK